MGGDERRAKSPEEVRHGVTYRTIGAIEGGKSATCCTAGVDGASNGASESILDARRVAPGGKWRHKGAVAEKDVDARSTRSAARSADGAIGSTVGADPVSIGATRAMGSAVVPSFGATRATIGAIRQVDSAIRCGYGAVPATDGAAGCTDGVVGGLDGAK
jgi:hypothetical protein